MPPSMKKSNRWLQTYNKQNNNSELKEESKSSFQDMVLKGYNNESPPAMMNKTPEYFENLDQSN